MALFRCASGGGGDLFSLLSNLPSASKITASNTGSISVTSGKHYLVIAAACYTSQTASVTLGGGTVVWTTDLAYSQVSNSRYALMKAYLVTATSSSINVNFASATNGRAYTAFQLD